MYYKALLLVIVVYYALQIHDLVRKDNNVWGTALIMVDITWPLKRVYFKKYT